MLSFLVLQIGCAAFALGLILERRNATTTHPIINAAVQELATGVVFLVPALLLPHEFVKWNWRGLGAIAYLFLVGGVVGYSGYIYAMKHLPVSPVSIYTYVNPVVAVLAGWLVYGEVFGRLDIVAGFVILLGVLIVKRHSGRADLTILEESRRAAGGQS